MISANVRTDSSGKVNESFLILLLASIQFTHFMDLMILFPLQDYFLRQFQIDVGQFSIVFASYSYAAAIAGIVGGNFIDRFNRKYATIFLYLGFMIGTFCCSIANSFSFLLVSRIVAGTFGGMLGGIVLSIIGDVFPIDKRGRATGAVMGAFSAASVIGVPTGLWIASKFSWNHTFGFIVLVGLPVLLGAFLFLPSIPAKQAKTGAFDFSQLKFVFSDGNHLKAIAFFMLVILGGFTVVTSIAVYMERNIGFSKTDVQLIYLFGGACTFFSSRLIGYLTDLYGKHRMFLNIVLLSIIPIVVITHLPKVPLWTALAVTTIFMVLVSGRIIPAIALVTSAVRPEIRGSFMSVNTGLQNVAAGLGANLAGLILVTLPDGSFQRYDIVGFCSVGFNLLALYISRKVRIVS
ncbi:MFS transporter [Leptospira perolatii]|uniref:MFS transporter n=1 Tax=Leptospira perolatii TaxID=2023191 RepID=A0A2M9ZPH2_9LEPT|nr:MFS transporter [Leptospira perolatii]PJZ70695.1 MFS transporter [Leptospira perolatii]PJZ73905.1 MFS transporter [Leptospira perolatii]